MNNKEKVYHITWTTFNSRVSERMNLYRIKSDKKGIFLDDKQEYEISKILGDIIREINLKVYAYNICNDHLHLLLQCEEKNLNLIIRRLKGKSTKLYKDLYNIEDKIHLWGQKFNRIFIKNKIQFLNTIDYIKNNRNKHGLKENMLLEDVSFCKILVN